MGFIWSPFSFSFYSFSSFSFFFFSLPPTVTSLTGKVSAGHSSGGSGGKGSWTRPVDLELVGSHGTTTPPFTPVPPIESPV